MDLSFLIPSKIRRLVLKYFVTNLEAEVYVRELARELNEAPPLIYRELINLENWGMLLSSKRGNQRVYRVNRRFTFLPTLQELFEKQYRLENPEKQDEIFQKFDLYKSARRLQKIPIPAGIKKPSEVKRRKPRAYDEEKLLKKNNS